MICISFSSVDLWTCCSACAFQLYSFAGGETYPQILLFDAENLLCHYVFRGLPQVPHAVVMTCMGFVSQSCVRSCGAWTSWFGCASDWTHHQQFESLSANTLRSRIAKLFPPEIHWLDGDVTICRLCKHVNVVLRRWPEVMFMSWINKDWM